MDDKSRTIALGTIATVLAAGLALVLSDVVAPTHNAPSRAGVAVATALAAGLAGWLLLGRHQASGRRQDLLLAWAVGVFVVVEATFSALPAMLDPDTDGLLVREDAIGRLLAAVALTLGVLLSESRLRRMRWCTVDVALASLAAIPLAGFALAMVPGTDGLPGGADPPVWIHVVQGACALLLSACAARLALRLNRERRELHGWIALASVLWMTAQLDMLLHASPTVEWISAADVLSALAALALLWGAGRQIGAVPSEATRRAVAQERRRIGRELHDGLAQELAYIAAHSTLMASGAQDPAAERVAVAATSALAESRMAITGLVHGQDGPLGPALAKTVERVASRTGTPVRCAVDDDVVVESARRADLLRIAQEATSNAVRHAHASEISLTLVAGDGDGFTLQIADDGIGFDDTERESRPDGGFGMTSMRERAERAGGHLRVSHGDDGGTVVEVRVA